MLYISYISLLYGRCLLTHLNLTCKPSTFVSEDGQIMLNLEVAISENVHRHFSSLRRFRVKRFSLRNLSLSYIIV